MREYGGYFSLELVKTGQWFQKYEAFTQKLNSGRAAIVHAVRDGGYKRVWLPLYTCHSVADILDCYNIPYVFYNINEAFYPENVTMKPGDVLVWTNYFGILGDCHVQTVYNQYKDVIFDNTQAFFAEPVLDAYNVYSCRKFFGVPDGAYLIHKHLNPCALEKDYSSNTSAFLLQSLEYGTNAAYSASMDNEERINQNQVLEMSPLTDAIMNAVDYAASLRKRPENYQALHQILGESNQLPIAAELPPQAIPMVYPYLCFDPDMRKHLVQNKVYISQWWKWVAESGLCNSFEKTLSQFLLPLPIDQRYDTQDMHHIADIIHDKTI